MRGKIEELDSYLKYLKQDRKNKHCFLVKIFSFFRNFLVIDD